MRAFSPDYLDRTREGMWDDSREALDSLSLGSRERILDVGCGTGELSRVLAEESSAEVIGCDADSRLLEHAREFLPVVMADARELPFSTDAFDLVVCQALLVNLHKPRSAVSEFARVSSDLVAAVEPDNGAVAVESSVEAEAGLADRARTAYLEGLDTDATLGADAVELFTDAGLEDVDCTRYDFVRETTPPYAPRELEAAREKVTGSGLTDDRETLLAGDLNPAGYDELRADWRQMGRYVVDQMQSGTYRRAETVPFFVTVGRVPDRSP